MSNSSSSDTQLVETMRAVALLLLIPWLIWALFWTWFIAAGLAEGNESGVPVTSIVIGVLYASMFLGSVVTSFRLRTEALGGKLLMATGVLILASVVTLFYALMSFDSGGLPSIGAFISTTGGIVLAAFFTVSLPPMVLGLLLFECARRSKAAEEIQDQAAAT